MRYILLILSFLAISCTPQRRLTRLCKNYPLLCERTADTIYKIRMIPKLDTVKVVDHRTIHDTITVTNGRATSRVVLKRDTILKLDSIMVTLTQVPDTIVQINTVTKYHTKRSKWWIWVLLISLTLIVYSWLRHRT